MNGEHIYTIYMASASTSTSTTVWCSLIARLYKRVSVSPTHTQTPLCPHTRWQCICVAAIKYTWKISLAEYGEILAQRYARLSLIHSCSMLLGYIILFALFFYAFAIIVDSDGVTTAAAAPVSTSPLCLHAYPHSLIFFHTLMLHFGMVSAMSIVGMHISNFLFIHLLFTHRSQCRKNLFNVHSMFLHFCLLFSAHSFVVLTRKRCEFVLNFPAQHGE